MFRLFEFMVELEVLVLLYLDNIGGFWNRFTESVDKDTEYAIIQMSTGAWVSSR